MWFSEEDKHSKDYLIRNYGCGTIATADLFLYLARQNEAFRSPEIISALNTAGSINYHNYEAYVRLINDRYTKTQRYLAVLGPRIAHAFNHYSKAHGLKFHAEWKWTLSYYDMYETISEMLSEDIPVILSIGPNTPKLWGKKGIPFYQRYEVAVPVSISKIPGTSGIIPCTSEIMPNTSGIITEPSRITPETSVQNPTGTKSSSESLIANQDTDHAHPGTQLPDASENTIANPDTPDPITDSSAEGPEASAQKTTIIVKVYRYKPVMENINSHYVTVTGIIKDDLARTIMLRISSWGKQYFIKYEEYREYIENIGGTFTSSMVSIKKKHIH